MMDDVTVSEWDRTKRLAWTIGILFCLWLWGLVIWGVARLFGWL